MSLFGYNLRSDIRWGEIFNRVMTDWSAQVELAAMGWRQAAIAARSDQALASNLQCNSHTIAGICEYLDYAGIRPDDITMQWALSLEGDAPPVPWFTR